LSLHFLADILYFIKKECHKEKRKEMGWEGMGINLNYVAEMPALLACPPYLTSF